MRLDTTGNSKPEEPSHTRIYIYVKRAERKININEERLVIERERERKNCNQLCRPFFSAGSISVAVAGERYIFYRRGNNQVKHATHAVYIKTPKNNK